MKEIAKDIFIETNFSGVVVGIIRTSHGQILIDAPFRMEDVRGWRTTVEKIGGGAERLLINLDTHLDRTLGVKGMESVVVAHQKSVMMVRSRPANARVQDPDAVSMWESYDGFNNIRWTPPEITFEDRVYLNWGNHPVILESHSGANAAGIWVILPEDRVVFVGDSVLVRQPPFLAFADMDLWLQDLKLLLSMRFRDYQIVSGRNGLVGQDDVREMAKLIKSIRTPFERLREKAAESSAVIDISAKIIKQFEDQPDYQEIYLNRLRWGLSMYYEQHGKRQKPQITVNN